MPDFEEIRCLDVSLAEKLEAYAAEIAGSRPTIANAYAAMVDRLAIAGAAESALAVGDMLPPFLLPDQRGRLVSSAGLLASGPLVVSFNRGHWCSFCKLELCALADADTRIAGLGASVVSIMPERAPQTRVLRETLALPFPILTDLDNGYALTCGLMVALGDTLRNLLIGRGRQLGVYQGGHGGFVPIPATYVVAPDGRIVGGGADVDFRRRVPIERILEALRAVR